MKKILIYPIYNNPYQELLYTEVKKDPTISIKYLSEDVSRFGGNILLIALPFYILKNRLQGFTIFHLHWVIFTKIPQNKFEARVYFIYSLFLINFIKTIGYKLIWTVHNILPHDTLTSNDAYVTKFLCEISDKKIVHSEFTIQELHVLGCNTKNITIIPHGNYIDYYKNHVTKKTARDYLHIDKDAFVFLFFGEIKVYKGIDILLDIFTTSIAKKYKKVILVIAGKLRDDSLRTLLALYSEKLSQQLQLFIRHITDEEVQYFMNSADIVVYPFKKITTSGSVILALSFGKAIVYPRIGSLQDLPDSIGFKYNQTDYNGLTNAMIEALRSNKDILKGKEKSAFQYAKSLSWDAIAKQTLSIYKQV